MKRIIILLLSIGFVVTGEQAYAQHSTSVKSKHFINAGFGLGAFGFMGSGILSVNATYEHGFGKNISAGASFGYVKTRYKVDWGYNNLAFGVRGSYHFNELFKIENEKIDIYGGASVLYKYYKSIASEPSIKSSGGNLDMAIHAGGRCLFTRKVGAFIELGYGLSPFQLGIVFKP